MDDDAKMDKLRLVLEDFERWSMANVLTIQQGVLLHLWSLEKLTHHPQWDKGPQQARDAVDLFLSAMMTDSADLVVWPTGRDNGET